MTDEKRYSEIEYNNWEEFRKICKVHADNMWVRNTCRLTDDSCTISTCFAFQLITLIRGYF